MIKGIGARRAALLGRLGLNTVGDLIEHFPRTYEDRSVCTPIAEAAADGVYTICAEAVAPAGVLVKNRLAITRLDVRDATGAIPVVWYNQPYMRNNFKKGARYYFTGKVSNKFGAPRLECADYSPYSTPGGAENLTACRIVPFYHATGGLTQKVLRAAIKAALDSAASDIEEFLPRDIMEGYGLCGRAFAIRNIHFPESGGAHAQARRRLVFEELFVMQAALFALKGMAKRRTGLVFGDTGTAGAEALLPFELTEGQRTALDDVKADFQSGLLANRLIQGDVGCGKTAVAMLASYIAMKNGYSAALMAPTDVLARQHYSTFAAFFGRLGFKTALLTGSLTAAERRRALESATERAMLVGTHALIQANVELGNIGLAITDEQHRFGVSQRAALSSKGSGAENGPHVLVMSATPIPRTMAMILYGDLDISLITGLPPGRRKIETYAVGPSYRPRVHAFIEKQLEAGRQAYVICPVIEARDGAAGDDRAGVLAYAEGLRRGAAFSGGGYKIECLHGKMPPEEKQAVMQRFAAGRTHVLVATTVVEVGLDVPNANIILIENAEVFGLAQLHQLRGRVGRGDAQSYCVLITDSKNELTARRMRALSHNADGFAISQMDLELRGPGDFFGTLQHGMPELKLANLYTDAGILKEAQAAASGYAQNNRPHEPLEREIARKISRIRGI